jgi:hypothetical protein
MTNLWLDDDDVIADAVRASRIQAFGCDSLHYASEEHLQAPDEEGNWLQRETIHDQRRAKKRRGEKSTPNRFTSENYAGPMHDGNEVEDEENDVESDGYASESSGEFAFPAEEMQEENLAEISNKKELQRSNDALNLPGPSSERDPPSIAQPGQEEEEEKGRMEEQLSPAELRAKRLAALE